MKILITGGAGFIGSHLANRLIKNNQNVFVVDNLSNGKVNYLNTSIKFFEEDIRTNNFLDLLRKIKPNFIFHLAAQSSLSRSLINPKEDLQINLLATQKLVEAANKNKVKKIIFASSAAVYEQSAKSPIKENVLKQPISIYGVSKFTSELLLILNYNLHKTPCTILRYANVYGKRQNDSAEGGVVAIFIKNFLRNKKNTINGNGRQTRDFIHVSDVNKANLKCLKNDIIGVYNVGTGIQTSINDLHNIIGRKLNKKTLPAYQELTAPEVTRNSLSFSKIKKEIAWKPKLSLSAGLDKTINYFKSRNI